MKKVILIILCSCSLQAILVDKIPLQWLKNTTFYLQDKNESMLLGQLFIRLENKKMDLGRFIAELLQLIALQNKKHKQLETRMANLEKQLLPPDHI